MNITKNRHQNEEFHAEVIPADQNGWNTLFSGQKCGFFPEFSGISGTVTVASQ